MKVRIWASLLLFFAFTFIKASESKILKGDQAGRFLEGAKLIHLNIETNKPTYVLYNEGDMPQFDSSLDYIKSIFQLNDNYSFKLIDRQEYKGEKHYRYQQFYDGHPIRHAHLIVHLNGSNEISAFNGNVVSGEIENSSLVLSEKNALEISLNQINAEIYKWELPEEERFIKKEQNNPMASFFPIAELVYISKDLSFSSENQKLTYCFDIYSQKPLGREKVYIDAQTGEVVFQEAILKHGGESKANAHTAYNGVQPIITDSMPSYFRLRDSLRGQGVFTYDLNNTRLYNSAVDLIDSTNSWSSFSPALDQYAIDAHWGTERTYDYMDSVHNRNSIDNNGFALRSYVHYDFNYVNAFWDGQRMTYGDGDATNSPLTTLDITAHEIAHGWTDYTSDLIYANESGALNESFSDILGVLVEFYSTPNSANWLIGEDIGRAIRSMSNPNSFGDPDTYGGVNWVDQNCFPSSSNDRCGVHTNSGVQNYWFYLLVNGGLGLNDIGDSIKVNGIGMDKAAQIAFRNNTVYLSPSSNYSDARFYSFRSAVDLYGACSPEVEEVINAWHAVGVGDAYDYNLTADFFAINDTSFCSTPVDVNFKASSSNIYNYYWDFGDGNTSSQREPTHTYSTSGNYDVKLIADGLSCGADTLIKTAYINVDSSNVCSTVLDGNLQTTSDCFGVFYDAGGLNGEYPLDQDDTLLIQVASADYITLYFDSIDIEAGYKGRCNHDFLEVFDGEGTFSKSLGRFCNNNKPDSIQSSSSSLTIVFHSDKEVVNGGVWGRWNCFQSNSKPNVDFSVSVDSSCNGLVRFNSEIKSGFQNLLWDFGDGNQSNEVNPTHVYTNDGNYDVKLIAQNTIGSDSLIKLNAINISRGVAPITISDTACIGDDITVKAQGASELIWYNSDRSDRAVHKGDSLTLQNRTNSISYFVESSPAVQSIINVPFNMIGATYYSDTAESIYFSVDEALIIEYFMAKVSRRTELIVDLIDSNGRIINSVVESLNPPVSQVSLDFLVFPGENYELTIGSREPGIMVNQTGANYPYTFGNLMSIDSSSLGLSGMPFFYYMNVKPLRCASMRSKVTAFVDTNCTITSINDKQLNNSKFNIYPIPFENEVNVTFPESESELKILIFDSKGSLVYENNISKSESKVKLSQLKSKGIYFLKAIGTNNIYQKKLIKQ